MTTLGGTLRICAVDDHPMLLLGVLTATRAAGAKVALVKAAPTVAKLLEDPPACDVVLLDLRLGDDSRPRDNVARLLMHGYRVLVFTEGHPEEWVSEAVAVGAHGVVLKSESPATLLDAVRAVAAGEEVFSSTVARVVHNELALRPQLSSREAEALRYAATGLTVRQIAPLMQVGEGTVKEYLKRVRAKYREAGREASTRLTLRQRAEEDGLLDG